MVHYVSNNQLIKHTYIQKMALLREQINEDDVLTLTPKPNFVIKTRLEENKGKRKALSKVFINVCSNPQVPLPPSAHSHSEDQNEEFSPEIVYPLIMNNQWEIPIITSDEREDTDKKGALSYVYDCFINDKCMTWVHMHRDLKDIVVEWCLESVELRFGISLDREAIKFPKMTYKGIDNGLMKLQVLKSDLDSRNFQRQKQELERVVKDQEHLLVVDAVKGKAEKLDVEQDDDDSNEESANNVTIFTKKPDIVNNGKPLIQEIESTSSSSSSDTKVTETNQPIAENQIKKKMESKDEKEQKEGKKQAKKQKKFINYEMSFNNLKNKNNKEYQLLIKLVPNLKDVSNFEIMFDSKKKSLMLKCIDDKDNAIFTNDGNPIFEIPVPGFLLRNDEELSFKSFYVREDNSLNIFV